MTPGNKTVRLIGSTGRVTDIVSLFMRKHPSAQSVEQTSGCSRNEIGSSGISQGEGWKKLRQLVRGQVSAALPINEQIPPSG